jgi:hypothetical protein
MGKWQDEYWQECISIAADECGATLTKEQIDYIAGSAQSGHEHYRMASGDDVASSNWHGTQEREKTELKAKARREADAEFCKPCQGGGRLTSYAGPWRSNSPCHHCNGNGRIYRRDLASYIRECTP